MLPTAPCFRPHQPARHKEPHRGRAPRTVVHRCSARHAPGAGTASVPDLPRVPPTGQENAAPGRSGPDRESRRWRAQCMAAVFAVVSLAVVGLVLAALPASATTSVHVVALAGSLDEVLNNLRNWIMGILALVATVFLTIGGVRYVISSGDAGEVSKAKECFKNAGLGYALAALAPLVVQILRSIVGA